MNLPSIMGRSDTGLLVIDLQVKLLKVIPAGESIVHKTAQLVEGAKILGLPVLATEQYPKGLGPTHPDLISLLNPPLEKVDFSCAALEGVLTFFKARHLKKILLVGIETHVCILQTALDLSALGFEVFGAVDAMGSRKVLDHDWALHRMEKAGVTLTTAEAALFEWTERAGTPEFKEISRLVKGDNNSLK
jgi:nicotinamidase-related amidase